MTDFLASVNTVQEAKLAEHAGADIIDLKNPDTGALGALSVDQITAILNSLEQSTLTSATIGDVPFSANTVIPAVRQIAQSGVNYIKIGLFPGGDFKYCLEALKREIKQHKLSLIAVIMADYRIDETWMSALADTGFHGVMLDTSNKSLGSLNTIISDQTLDSFILQAKQTGLYCGLAGSLTIHDIPQLIRKQPDYLGFRGALCESGQRTAGIHRNQITAVRKTINAALQIIQNAQEPAHAV